ncbi:cystatin-2-like [Crotalus adamanteus]|uniref:Cystatin-2 n=2 Tax=Crotalus adamanteus TaxID=8729 RepID=CYT2_CROAD|nr:cystatin-2 [Crotalus tigris]J3SE80.1 RecName: Full=Cystatin-2; Flags: Precursor [Crotalus adamanteus]
MALLRGFLVCSLLLLSCICKEALGTRLLGGLENASPEEPGVARALQFAMNEYNRGSNDMYSSRVSEVVEAQKQIVSGIKYYFTVKIGRTVCRKGATDLENCAFHNAPKLAQTMTCTFEVYNIPWRNFISLEKSSCT